MAANPPAKADELFGAAHASYTALRRGSGVVTSDMQFE